MNLTILPSINPPPYEDLDAGIWTVGTAMGLIHDIPTCDELISRIIAEAEEIITGRLGAMCSQPTT